MHTCEIDRLLYAEEKILPEFKDVLNDLPRIFFHFEDIGDFSVDSINNKGHVAFETFRVGWLALAVEIFAEEYTVMIAGLVDA